MRSCGLLTSGVLRRLGGAVVALLWVLSMAPPAQAATAEVRATVETAPVPGSRDAADDPAVWIHPTDPALSTVIGTDKSRDGRGLGVWDLSGEQLFFYADGRMNNVDVRYNFPLGNESVALVAVSNRERSIDFYRVNVADRSLTKAGSFPPTADIATPRGISLYHSPVTKKFHVFVTDVGNTEQYELDGSSGVVRGALVRKIKLTSPTEGLVTDDELQRLYIAQENAGGIWRFGAEPGDPTSGTRVVATTDNGGDIVQDIKGISIYYGSGGTGYLLAASQGASRFHVYDRVDSRPLGSFSIVSGTVDGVTGEDGIDVTNVGLGAGFPQGVFITQDHTNEGGGNQNFKLVPWEAIAGPLALIADTSFDPRRIGAGGGGGPTPPREDSTAPTVTAVSPARGATDVATSTSVTATFSEDVTGVSGASFVLVGSGGAVAGEVVYDAATKKATLTPAAALAAGATYTATVKGGPDGVKDLTGNPLADTTCSFTTSAAPPPPPPPTGGETVTLTVAEDSYVSGGSAGSNFGTAAVLGADASPAETSYLKFDLGSYAGRSITGATLQVRATSSGSTGTQNVKLVADDSWTERGLTYTNRPAVGTAVGRLGPTTADTDYSVPLTASSLPTDRYLSLALDSASSDGVDLGSGETPTAPKLVLALGP